MRLTEFDFDLPPDRIAQHPVRPRDAARLLHVGRDGLSDRAVRDLTMLLRPGDMLVTPTGWYHEVYALTSVISISRFVSDAMDARLEARALACSRRPQGVPSTTA